MSRSEAESVAGSDEDAGSDDNVYLGDYDDPVTTTAQPPMTREEADAMAANFSLMAEIDNAHALNRFRSVIEYICTEVAVCISPTENDGGAPIPTMHLVSKVDIYFIRGILPYINEGVRDDEMAGTLSNYQPTYTAYTVLTTSPPVRHSFFDDEAAYIAEAQNIIRGFARYHPDYSTEIDDDAHLHATIEQFDSPVARTVSQYGNMSRLLDRWQHEAPGPLKQIDLDHSLCLEVQRSAWHVLRLSESLWNLLFQELIECYPNNEFEVHDKQWVDRIVKWLLDMAKVAVYVQIDGHREQERRAQRNGRA